MPRGLPDYYNPATLVSQRLNDVGNLVVTNFGVNSVDGRGRWFYVENWRSGSPGGQDLLFGGGDGSAPRLSAQYPEIGEASMRFPSGSVGSSGVSYMRRHLLNQARSRVGLECGWRYGSGAGNIIQALQYRDDDVSYYGYLRVRADTGECQIFSAGALALIGNVGVAGSVAIWLPAKIVVDFETGYYIRAVVGQREFDLSSYPVSDPGAISKLDIILIMQSNPWGVPTKESHLGHFIVTLDEP